MTNAACGVHKVSNDNNQISSSDVANTKVSGDGAQQKRGYSSRNDVVTLVVSGKYIDNEAISTKWKQCDICENKKGSQ